METEINEFGPYIRELRTKRGLTISQVAGKMNISNNYLSQLERGVRKPTDDLIRLFSKFYNIDEDILFWKARVIPSNIREEILNNKGSQQILSYIQKMSLAPNEKMILEEKIILTIAEYLKVNRDDILNG